MLWTCCWKTSDEPEGLRTAQKRKRILLRLMDEHGWESDGTTATYATPHVAVHAMCTASGHGERPRRSQAISTVHTAIPGVQPDSSATQGP
ncbi:hypothetical protein GCM10010307_78680 [Streptomyces vastus]|uniref:Uncharacterized protein n=1 Tax=Streptomyces vastus TaxID=285451 RepID=A0ABN3RU46_9ACTN